MTHFTKRTVNRTTQNRPMARRSEQPQQDNGRRKQQGNPRELHQKYLLLAKEASSAGNHVDAEQFYQYAEHYYRIVSERSFARVVGQPELG